jgi:hypothetical protein
MSVNTTKCPDCGAELADTFGACPYCGRQLCYEEPDHYLRLKNGRRIVGFI